MLDTRASVPDVKTCACGLPAISNGRECVVHFRQRILSVSMQGPDFDDHRGQMRIGDYRARTMDGTATKRWNRELDDYAAVRKEGSQPATTRQRDIDNAKRASDSTGEAFRAGVQ